MPAGHPPPSPRHTALDILLAWEAGSKTITTYLEPRFEHAALAGRDRRLCHHLVMGVLVRLRHLDETLSRYSRHPLNTMLPLTRMALRLGCYQLLFMDRIPPRAAVNETVALLRQRRQPPWLTGFANGILRTIAQNRQKILASTREAGPCTSHPAWLTDRWRLRYGSTLAEAICRCNDQEPKLCLRCNTLKIQCGDLAELLVRAGISASPGHYAPNSLILNSWSGPVSQLPGYGQGYFQIQDEGAQLLSLLCGPLEEGGSYLDGCAGLGGKTSHLAELLPSGARLYAVEPDTRRFGLLQENLIRLGLDARCSIRQSSLSRFSQTCRERFDVILIDAPCSGTGVIRKHPDIRWNRTAEDLPVYQKQQLALLHEATQLLQPCGALIYTTCSLEEEENERVVEMFMQMHPDFRVADCRLLLPASAVELASASGFFHCTPDQGVDGFFGARLVRDGL